MRQMMSETPEEPGCAPAADDPAAGDKAVYLDETYQPKANEAGGTTPFYAVPKPSVGRIVHFFTTITEKQSNGQGIGPYPALVTQTSGPYANLRIFPPFADDYDAGSVSHVTVAKEQNHPIWWDWPARV